MVSEKVNENCSAIPVGQHLPCSCGESLKICKCCMGVSLQHKISNTKLEALQRLRNRAQSIIERAKIKDQCSGDWLTVEQLINFDRSVMTYKMMNKICPESLWDTYKTRNMYSSYRTRNCTDIQLPRYNLEYSKKSFHYSGIKAWNKIPTTIRNSLPCNNSKNTSRYI